MEYLNDRLPTRKGNYTEYMFALFLVIFSLAKPITQPSGYSGILLFMITLICIYKEWSYVRKCGIASDNTSLLSITFVIGTLLISDLLLRSNENTLEYIYDFTLYGILPLFFLSFVHDYKAVLWFFSIITVINGCIYIADPIIWNYELSGGYMPFGFNQMLPAFAGSMIMYFYFKKKFGLAFMVLFVATLFIFANKSAFLTAIILFIFGYIYIYKKGKVNKIALVFVIAFLSLGYYYFLDIVSIGANIASTLGFEDSYSLRTFQAILSGSEDMVFQARYDVWAEAERMIDTKPEFGWGVGRFEMFSQQPYPHNFILQIMVEYGWAGLIVFFFISLISLRNMAKFRNSEKTIFAITILILWIAPLAVSVTYWRSMYFWVFFALCFMKKQCVFYES